MGVKKAVVRAVSAAVRPRVSDGVWQAMKQVRFELYLQRCHAAGVRQAVRFDGHQEPLRLNLACGFHPKAGWVNVDLIEGADLQLDLRRPLPFPTGSVSHIYSEHPPMHFG